MAQGLIKVCQAHSAEEYNGSTFPYLSDLYQFTIAGKRGHVPRAARRQRRQGLTPTGSAAFLRDEHLYDFVAHFYPEQRSDAAGLFLRLHHLGQSGARLRWINLA